MIWYGNYNILNEGGNDAIGSCNWRTHFKSTLFPQLKRWLEGNGGMFLNAKYQWLVVNYRHVIKTLTTQRVFLLRKLPILTTDETGSCSPSVRDCHCWDLSPFASRGCTELLAAPLESPHSQSEEASQGRVSDVSFHRTVYSQCSNTETAWAGASEEDPEQRNPWAFTPSQSKPCATLKSPKAHPSSQPSAPAVCPSVPFPDRCHCSLCTLLCKGKQPMASVGSQPELNLHLNLHPQLQLAEPATWPGILQHFPQF